MRGHTQAYFIMIINIIIPLSQLVLNNSGCDTCSLVGTFSVNWQDTRMSLAVLRVQSGMIQAFSCRLVGDTMENEC